jgi:hypothetical protein
MLWLLNKISPQRPSHGGSYFRQPAQLEARHDAQLEPLDFSLAASLELDVANNEGLRLTRRLAHTGHVILSRDERTSRSNSLLHF